MTMNPLGLYRLKVIGDIHGQQTETAFHFRGHTANSFTSYLSEATALFTDFRDNVLPSIKGCCSQEFKLKSLILTQLSPKPGVVVEQVLSTEGIQAGASLPSFCGGVLSIRTGFAGRSYHGRIYLPGIPEDFSSNSRLDPLLLGQYTGLGATLTTRYGPSGTANSARLGVFSRRLGVTRVIGPPPTLTYNLAGWIQHTSLVVRPEIGTIRKRKLGRGV